ncbi:MAG: hypothetical protein LUQ04_03050 [Methanoregula sp.]|nr:hypothetical protein [Methanoregula sp.]
MTGSLILTGTIDSFFDSYPVDDGFPVITGTIDRYFDRYFDRNLDSFFDSYPVDDRSGK